MPTWRWRLNTCQLKTRAPVAANGSPSITSCCASKRSWATAPSIPAFPPLWHRRDEPVNDSPQAIAAHRFPGSQLLRPLEAALDKYWNQAPHLDRLMALTARAGFFYARRPTRTGVKGAAELFCGAPERTGPYFIRRRLEDSSGRRTPKTRPTKRHRPTRNPLRLETGSEGIVEDGGLVFVDDRLVKGHAGVAAISSFMALSYSSPLMLLRISK